MSDISDLENRISAAMDRIGRGLEALGQAPEGDGEDNADVERLERALEDEKLAGQQLEERVRALTGKLETLETELAGVRDEAAAAQAARAEAETALEMAADARDAAQAAPAASDEELAAVRQEMSELAGRLRRMRRLTKNLRENNQRLREAAEKGVVDPELINASLKGELEQLQALRETELVQTDAILAGLRPMLSGVAPVDETDSEPLGDG